MAGWRLTLADMHVRSPAIPQRKPLDLSFGENKEHDEQLDADSDDDDHDGPGQLLGRHHEAFGFFSVLDHGLKGKVDLLTKKC